MGREVQDYVPRHNEPSNIAPPSNKDFVTTNRKEMKMAPASRTAPAYIDKVSGGGARFTLETSGLVPKYTKKADYGKAPAYLSTIKAAIQTRHVPPPQAQSHIRQISEEERLQILAGLRKNWDSLHREYQGLSMFTDTIPKKTKRNNMEARLNQLEADINR